jgi:hypothetical protein
MLTELREPSLQIKAYLKRMASSYGAAPEPEPSAEIEALLRALQDSPPGRAARPS